MENIHQNKWLGRLGRFLSYISILFVLGSLILTFNKAFSNIYIIVCAVLLLIWLALLLCSAALVFPLFLSEYRSFLMSIPTKLFNDNVEFFLFNLNEKYGMTLIIISSILLGLSLLCLFFDRDRKKSKFALVSSVIWALILIVSSITGAFI